MPKMKSMKRGASSAAELANPPTQRASGQELPAQAAYKLKPAAAYVGGLSVPTMMRLVRDGRLRPCRQVRHLLFLKSELDRFLVEGM
jgi:hypothetical protein